MTEVFCDLNPQPDCLVIWNVSTMGPQLLKMVGYFSMSGRRKSGSLWGKGSFERSCFLSWLFMR